MAVVVVLVLALTTSGMTSVSGHPKLVSEHCDVLPKPLSGDLLGLVGIKVGIPHCVACLLQPRKHVARQPDTLLDQPEVLGQPLDTAKKIDADITLLISDERVLRAEVSVSIRIAATAATAATKSANDIPGTKVSNRARQFAMPGRIVQYVYPSTSPRILSR